MYFPEAESVGYYGDGAEGHRGAGENGAEQEAKKRVEDAGGDGNSRGVVQEREEKVLADISHGGAAKGARPSNPAQVAAQQGDARTFHGDVRSRSHGDANVGLRERGSVIHAVARHGRDMPLGLQLLDDFAFLMGQDAGVNSIDAQRARYRVGGCAAIASDHYNSNALAMKAFDRFGSGGFYWIGNADDSSNFAVDGYEHHRLTGGFQRVGAFVKIAWRYS